MKRRLFGERLPPPSADALEGEILVTPPPRTGGGRKLWLYAPVCVCAALVQLRVALNIHLKQNFFFLGKSRLRTSLSQQNLTNLLTLYLSISEISEFDFATAVKIFLNMRDSQRRLNSS